MVERLARASEKKDLLVLNFGLHFSETYKQELEQLVQQVGLSFPCDSICKFDFMVHSGAAGLTHDREPEIFQRDKGIATQVLKLRREGEFPFLLWKDTAPQHFESLFGEYPQVSTAPSALSLHTLQMVGLPFHWSSTADQQHHDCCSIYTKCPCLCLTTLVYIFAHYVTPPMM